MGVISEGSNEIHDVGFRISVNLSQFFEDERARCYISVQGHRPVRWLRRRLRKLFNIPKSVSILSRGHLLPLDEPLSLLHSDDPVDVVKSHTKNCNHSETSQDLLDHDQPPRKKKIKLPASKDDSFHTVTNNHSHDITIDEAMVKIANVPSTDENFDVTDGTNNDEAVTTETATQLHQVKEQALALLQSYEQTDELQETMNVPMRRHRVRRRVRRRKPPALALPLPLALSLSPPPPPTPSLPLPPSPESALTSALQETPVTIQEHTREQPSALCGLTQDAPRPGTTQKPSPSSPSQTLPESTLAYFEKETAVIRNEEIVPRTPRVVKPLNIKSVASC